MQGRRVHLISEPRQGTNKGDATTRLQLLILTLAR
jgi:hypothetical protein